MLNSTFICDWNVVRFVTFCCWYLAHRMFDGCSTSCCAGSLLLYFQARICALVRGDFLIDYYVLLISLRLVVSLLLCFFFWSLHPPPLLWRLFARTCACMYI